MKNHIKFLNSREEIPQNLENPRKDDKGQIGREESKSPSPPVYGHWQIGVLPGTRALFWLKMDHVRHFGTIKLRSDL